MSLIAAMLAMRFLKALFSLKSHPIQRGNRTSLVSLQQLSGIYRSGQGAKWLLSLFVQSRRSAAKNYCDFVEKVDIATLENPAKDITGGFILGGVE